MSKQHFGQHADCFACKIQSVQVSSAATPTRSTPAPRSTRNRDAKDNSNAWERGVKTAQMPDGSHVPYLDDTGQPIGLKKWANEPKWQQRADRLHKQAAQQGNKE